MASVAAPVIHDLFRRRSLEKAPPAPAADTTIAQCAEAYLPLYTFAAYGADGNDADVVPRKLVRVDSIPEVPDYFAQPRCDSPPAFELNMPYMGMDGAMDVDGGMGFAKPKTLAGSSSFNNLPLLAHEPASVVAARGLPSLDEDLAVVPDCGASAPTAFEQRSVRSAAAHTQPRRNSSDVALGAPARGGSGRGLLEAAVTTLWEDRADRGLFRYDVSQCTTRVIPGRLGFVAQLNEGRATKKRPTEFSMDRVLQPFDPARFHFCKASLTEVLLAFVPIAAASDAAAAPRLSAPAAPLAAAAADAGAVSDPAAPSLVLINVSPIEENHVLLVPRVTERLPQALAPDTVLLALQFASQLRSPTFRVGYNSLGAYATINHLHFHAYHLPLAFPVETAATEPLPGALAAPLASALRKRRLPAVRVSRLVDYPVRGWVAEADGPVGPALEALAAVVGEAALRMQAANQPFNLFISDQGRRVFVLPQCYAERQAAGVVPAELLDTGVNPASFEIAGHMVLKRAEDFEGATEEWATRLLAGVSLEEERFVALARACFGVEGAGAAASYAEEFCMMQ
ncbi:hypothetical protein HYH03_004872 [Edaphochlamys debaryana]|uniref:GDP-D-glucose phosphorylase 1 n=1 Tax=Edaphochlamys debaryana TaxID=47281 RepID=A0A836C347_9CHLO|nr:hypothetical protein HYH03_004872 [Edaphochlamys debaryana]|eukprot:KAG2497289.1 hypothetical protein HYH03_004872 [Edaphochlamys debaryana]